MLNFVCATHHDQLSADTVNTSNKADGASVKYAL